MREHQKKNISFAQQIRKARREQIRAEKRVWNQLPSPIVQLPYRIQNSDWKFYQQYLDSITEADLQIVDQNLILFVQGHYKKQFDKQKEKKDWQIVDRVNLLRMVLRLRIADSGQIRQALLMLGELNGMVLRANSRQVMETFLKIIKELAVFLQGVEKEGRIDEQNLLILNKVVGDIKIYKYWVQTRIGQFEELLSKYRIFYIYLLAHQSVSFSSFITSNNIGELFCLIDDVVYFRESMQIVKLVDVILKVLALSASESQDNQFCLRGLEILLIDGLERAKEYLTCKENFRVNNITFLYGGKFFIELLNIVSNCEVGTLVHSIELLAQLFQWSDSYIQAIMRVQSKSRAAQFEEKGDKESQVVKIKAVQFSTYSQFFIFSASNLLSEVRCKVYWLLSNILGSERFFFSYGFQFLKHIYLEKKLVEQEENKSIQNEVHICILNFICNLNLQSGAVSSLLDVTYRERESEEQNGLMVGQGDYPENCFLFCVDTTFKLIEHLFWASEKEESKGQLGSFLHRSLYALFNLIETSKEYKDMRVYERLMHEAERRKIPVYIQSLYGKIMSNKSEWMEVSALIQQILKLFQSQVKHL